jgi:methyl-accepting chemotaxis protein
MNDTLPPLSILETALGRVAATVTGPVTVREAAFLALGQGVFSLHAQVRDLAARAADLSGRICGAALDEVLDLLTRELELLRQAVTTEQDSVAVLEETVVAVRHLQAEAAPLGRLVRSLTMLGIAVKIESARMGEEGRGFAALAGDVDSLARRIPEQAATITAEATAMATELASQAAQVQRRRQQERDLVAGVLDHLERELATLAELSHRSQALSASIPQAAEAISAHMNALVAGVQIHDMARQRLEHVAEALDEACRAAAAVESAEPLGTAALMVDISALQERQLVACAEDLSRALADLADHTAALGEQAGRVAQQAASCFGGEGGSLLAAVYRELTPLLDHVASAAEEEAAMGEALTAAQKRLTDLGRLVEGIESIGLEIELVALNASIRAARAGVAGRCLGVIAGAIQEMSVQARGQTKRLTTSLQGILATASRLTANRSEVGVAAAVGRFQELLGRLDSMAETTGQELGALARAAQEVEADCHRLLALLEEQTPAVAEIHALAGAIASALAPWQSHAEILARARRPEALTALMERYTMEQERAVHDGKAIADDLGDNIELF